MSKINKSCLPQAGNAFTQWLGKSLLKVSGWRISGSLPEVPKMVVAVGPHTSNWDFVVGVYALFALRLRIRFLAKHSLFIPIAKQLLDAIGGIPVNRKAGHGVVQQVAKQFADEENIILAIAPEGTRSPIFPWKTGFLAIAHKANVPVVMVGFDFANKQIIFGPSFMPSGCYEEDMKIVYEYYATIPAKYKHKSITHIHL